MTGTTSETPKRARSMVSAAGNLATKVLIYPLALAASVVVDRTLGPHDRGLFSFLLLVGNFVLPLLTFGFGGATIYFVSSGKYRTRDVTLTVILVGFLQGLLSALVTYGLWRMSWLGETGAQTPAFELMCILALVPLQGMQLMGSRILFGESRFGASNLLSIARAALTPLLLLVFVVGLGMGLSGAIVATVIITVGVTAATLATLSPHRMAFRLDYGFLREASAYGWRMWIGDVATRANLRLDQVLLGVFASPAALGNYAVAVSLSEILWIGADSVSPVLFNRLAQARDDSQRIELMGRIHRLGFAAMCVVAVVAGVGGWWVIPWAFGERFEEAALLFELLLPGTVILITAKLLTKYFAAVARPELSGRLGVISGVVAAVAYAMFVPLATTMGAAIASSLSYAVMSAVAFVMYRRLISPERGRLFRIEAADGRWLRMQLRR